MERATGDCGKTLDLERASSCKMPRMKQTAIAFAAPNQHDAGPATRRGSRLLLQVAARRGGMGEVEQRDERRREPGGAVGPGGQERGKAVDERGQAN